MNEQRGDFTMRECLFWAENLTALAVDERLPPSARVDAALRALSVLRQVRRALRSACP